MVVKDRIYGEFKIDSPAIEELLRSGPLKRLKKIAQYGIPAEFYHLRSYSRYLHSVGVMLLLKKFDASEEEQIAGLLHDVSHTAFSHLVDWFVGSGETEDFQDRQHTQFIETSEVSRILKKHGFNPKRISDYHHFTLLEQDIPHLCADRLDYSLREFSKKVTMDCLQGLTTYKGRFVFKDKKSARLFAETFLKKQIEHWGGEEAVIRYTILAKTIERAIILKLIRFKDFWQYDQFILKKLRNSKDKLIQSNLTILRRKSLSGLKRSEKVLKKKFRHVDPDVLRNDKSIPLTKIDKNFAKILERQKEINRKGIRMPLL